MGNAQGIRAGQAYVEIGGDESKLDGVLTASQQKFSAWARPSPPSE